VIAIRHHQPLRQDAKAAIQDAHVDVQRKGRYTLALKKGRGEGDHRRVGRAQKLFMA
jgi:hypothetical protein